MEEDRWTKVKAFAFDVDGVLTDGGILADCSGELYRTFDSKDGFALRMASMHGYHLAIITGGRSVSIRERFRSCGIPPEDVYLRSRDKVKDFNDFCARHGIAAEEVVYIGDDVPDIPVMKLSGIGACPSDAVREVIDEADFVSTRPGGRQCVREIVEKVMRLHGCWILDVKKYEEKF